MGEVRINTTRLHVEMKCTGLRPVFQLVFSYVIKLFTWRLAPCANNGRILALPAKSIQCKADSPGYHMGLDQSIGWVRCPEDPVRQASPRTCHAVLGRRLVDLQAWLPAWAHPQHCSLPLEQPRPVASEGQMHLQQWNDMVGLLVVQRSMLTLMNSF